MREWYRLLSLNYTVRFGGRSNALPRKKVTKKLISVEINGEPKQIPPGLHVRGLLEFLEIDTQRVAVELNRDLIRKADWEGTSIPADAKIEIVMFVGGGTH